MRSTRSYRYLTDFIAKKEEEKAASHSMEQSSRRRTHSSLALGTFDVRSLVLGNSFAARAIIPTPWNGSTAPIKKLLSYSTRGTGGPISVGSKLRRSDRNVILDSAIPMVSFNECQWPLLAPGFLSFRWIYFVAFLMSPWSLRVYATWGRKFSTDLLTRYHSSGNLQDEIEVLIITRYLDP